MILFVCWIFVGFGFCWVGFLFWWGDSFCVQYPRLAFFSCTSEDREPLNAINQNLSAEVVFVCYFFTPGLFVDAFKVSARNAEF